MSPPRLGSPEPGEWHLILNRVVVVARQKLVDKADARYRWLVVEPPLLAQVLAAVRTTQDWGARAGRAGAGVPHDKHPPDHEPQCKIDEDGEISRTTRRLDQWVFREAEFSCHEPDEQYASLIREQGIPRPRRQDRRRRGQHGSR